MINEEQYNNLLTLLQKTLEFYSKEENYSSYSPTIPTSIDLDKGFQAKEAIKKIDELFDNEKDMEKQFEDLLKNHGLGDVEASASFTEMIEDYKRRNNIEND